jgi:DNA-binding transcriptional MerR regulator
MIPKKLYYSISEVCTLTELEQHVLRYWESEFPQLRPKKNRAGNRAYRDKDIDIIKYIKHLLYEEKFTIPGAKKKIAESKLSVDLEADISPVEVSPEVSVTVENVTSEHLASIKKELRELLDFLKKDEGGRMNN